MSDGQFISKHRDRRSGCLAEVVLCRPGHEQLHRKVHLGSNVVTAAIEEAHNVPGFSARISHRRCGIHERTVRQQAEEVNGVKEVGFADAVGTENTGEWPKTHVEVQEILESRDRKAGEHRLPPLYWQSLDSGSLSLFPTRC